MPSEPDNKMDQLLKAYAQKRREEGGDAFGLHPATRKLMHAEVARRWPKRSKLRGMAIPFLHSVP